MWSFTRVHYLIETSIDLVMCFNYGGLDKLQKLCDYDNIFTLEDAQGTCFVDLSLIIDTAGVSSMLDEPQVFELGTDPVT